MYFNGVKLFNIVLGKGTGKTINISNNGTYNVDNYSNAIINVNQSVTLPTLTAPNSVTRTPGNDYFQVNNPSNNGKFATKIFIYNEQTLIYTYSDSYLNSPSNYNIYITANLPVGNHKIYASFGSDYFNESPKTGYISFSIYSITRALNGISSSNLAGKILNDIKYQTTLTPVAGKYLPVHLILYDADDNTNVLIEDVDYKYNMYTGLLELYVPCNLIISATALVTPKLKEVDYIYNEKDNSIDYDDVTYAENYYLYIDDVLIATESVS